MSAKKEFSRWALGFSGCDGGDIGSPEERAIWVCGIEWGGGHDPYELKKDMANTSIATIPPEGYKKWDENLNYNFNIRIMKLLGAINGYSVYKSRNNNYKDFAKEIRPFIKGSKGYFKLNLYPIAFKNTNATLWRKEYYNLTGFTEKKDYMSWCRKKRFPRIREWVAKYKPRLILCFGKSYKEDFKLAFADEDSKFRCINVDDKKLYWCVNADGAIVVILPFVIGRYGLNKDCLIQKAAEEIAKLL